MTSQPRHKKSKAPFYAGFFAIAVGVVLIAIKSYAYYQSGSASVLSSLTDSVLDIMVSLMALASVYYASRPADEDHRWGHGKMEAVSALFQAAIIAGGAVFLVFESFSRLASPVEIKSHTMAVIVLVVSIILSVLLVMVQRYAVRKSNSLAIEADSAHYSSDVVINAGAIGVLLLSLWGAPSWIDPAFAIFVAAFMVYLARGIARKSLDVLLDRELPVQDRKKIVSVIQSHEEVLGWHDLRTHRNGTHYVMSFDIEVDPGLSLWAAHAVTKDLERDILRLYPDTDIIIHVDPEGFTEDARHRVKGVHH